MYEVKGVQRSAGDFNDAKTGKKIEYSGYRLHLQGQSDKVEGVTCASVFVKDSAKNDLLSAVGLDVKQWIGKKVEVYYDDFKKPAWVQLVK